MIRRLEIPAKVAGSGTQRQSGLLSGMRQRTVVDGSLLRRRSAIEHSNQGSWMG